MSQTSKESIEFNEDWEKENSPNFRKVDEEEKLKDGVHSIFYSDKDQRFSITDWISQGVSGAKVLLGLKDFEGIINKKTSTGWEV